MDYPALGVREVEDVRAAAEYLAPQPGVDPLCIGVFGLSVGSSFALMGAAGVPNSHAVAVDSVFSSADWFIPAPDG